MGGSEIPSSLASPFPGRALGKGLLMWANVALSKSVGTAGKKPLLGRGGGGGGMGCGLVVELLVVRRAVLSSFCFVSWAGRLPGAEAY